MALSAEQARIADSAVARVESAVAQARAAIAGEWVSLTWLTGSSSAEGARAESLRQSEKILATLRERRPGLDAAGLVGFVQLAAAGANVDTILAEARRMTGSGFTKEVVKPTIAALDPTNLSGPVGKLALAAAVVLVLVVLAKR